MISLQKAIDPGQLYFNPMSGLPLIHYPYQFHVSSDSFNTFLDIALTMLVRFMPISTHCSELLCTVTVIKAFCEVVGRPHHVGCRVGAVPTKRVFRIIVISKRFYNMVGKSLERGVF